MRLISTRGEAAPATFLEASVRNLPEDGGLYLPAQLEPLADVDRLLGLSSTARREALLTHLLGDELGAQEIARLVAALDIPSPLVALGDGRFALELFHGPSLSFKDFGARMLAEVLDLIDRRARHDRRARRARQSTPRRQHLVLTATSGDTGAAVAAAFHARPGFRAAVLFPRGRIAPRQESQIATLGGNVRSFAVDGDFDDCQRLVKHCFADREYAAAVGLVSANSIHIARLLAQTVYYFEGGAAFAAWRREHPRAAAPVVAVPSGNFGNLCACLLAQRLGLVLGGVVLATNANRTVPHYLETGDYAPGATVATLSNAMDVAAPNNWQRVEWLFGGDRQRLRQALRWGSLTETETLAEIAALDRLGYRADPHGAVAAGVLRRQLRGGETGIFLATAHPAKFAATADGIPLPASLSRALHKPSLAEDLANDPSALRRALDSWTRSEG
jgi:threonine synthase